MDVVERRLTFIWALLIGLTLASWHTGKGDAHPAAVLATALIMILTFAKVALVVMEFMEVRHAPRVLQGAMITWIAGAFVAITYSLIRIPQ